MFTLRAAVAAIACGLLSSAAFAQAPIVIGASTPLTGPVSHYGQHARWGSQLAVDEANAKGGINGRKIEIDYQDNRCNPAEAVKSVTQMLASKKYAAIFDGLCSSAALAIMPLIERAKVPFIIANASATSIAEKSGVGGNQWTFKVNPTDASMLDALVGWLNKDGRADSIAFLGEDTDYGRAGSSGFESALAKYGKKLVMADYFQKGTADYTGTSRAAKAPAGCHAWPWYITASSRTMTNSAPSCKPKAMCSTARPTPKSLFIWWTACMTETCSKL